jgi:hypothetical protein
MFVDDLIKAFLEHESVKPKLKKLEQHIVKKMEQANQTVHIQDLVIRPSFDRRFGESGRHTNTYTQSAEERLRAHIAMLFRLVNEHHRAYNCEKEAEDKYHLKEGMENCVTRLSMPEFSLYTQTELTLEQFYDLNRDVFEMAVTLEPNVHVLLSSFAVKDDLGKLQNFSLFVEGGTPPTIHPFAKTTASMIDVDYHKPAGIFSQQDLGMKPTFQADFVASTQDTIITTGSVFEVSTAGGASYTQAIDVCLDHAFEHSKELLLRRILGDVNPNELLPEQVEQCITSNYINLFDTAIVASTVLHADPHYATLGDFQEHPLRPEIMARALPPDYAHCSITPSATGYLLSNPAFGSDCKIDVLAKRPAAHYKPIIAAAVRAHNHRACQHLSYSAKQSHVEGSDIIHRLNEGQSLSKAIDTLEQHLLEKCRPGFWQKLFHTEEYQQKLAAIIIIHTSFSMIKGAIKTQGEAAIFMIRPWKNDLCLRLNFSSPTTIPSSLATGLVQDVKEAIDEGLQKQTGIEFEEPVTSKRSPSKR